ncbi:MAG: hypothetical protein HZA93_24885 [Verrucomicrobia bacterium]|nr:hypothetical protein [Verrucomicrobiota bacterium]
MHLTQQIALNATVVVALVAVAVGFTAVWSNPERLVNRGFFAASLFVAVWLYCLDRVREGGVDGQFWAQATAIAGAAIIVPIWFIKEAIVHDSESGAVMLKRGIGWIVASAFLGFGRASNWLVNGVNVSLWGFILGSAALYGFLLRQTLRDLRLATGVKRLELQITLLGGSSTGLAIMLLVVVRNAADLPWVTQLYPLAVLVFYSGTVVAITTSRVFNARQILLAVAQKFSLVGLVGTVAYGLDLVLSPLVAAPVALLSTVALALWFAAELNGWLNRLFQFYPQATAVRQAAFEAARREAKVENLEREFLSILKGWGQADHVLLLCGERGELRGSGLTPEMEAKLLRAMRQLRWATPERLTRERSSPDREEVARFLAARALGVIVIGEGPTLTALVGVGVPANRRPFTYPQVTQLIELASIMESALERAHFAVKVQHTEQLATVGLLGASLAHEIRNPLVTIKTFVQLLPQHHHDAAFRAKFFRLIGDEVNRIDRLTEQLLDLASPRAYVATQVELHPVLRASLDLVAAKASDKNIAFLTDFTAKPDLVHTDASAAKQVMLNLCFNAIQAVEGHAGERWVKVATRNVPAGVEMAVADSGPGIAPDIRPRLFQPFQTTKSSGFGLGLAICSDILANLDATISVDPAGTGSGATFRVIFPCQPQSS